MPEVLAIATTELLGAENPSAFLSAPTAQALAYALVHSLWQGLLVAVLLWLVLRLLEGGPSSLRYVVSCIALMLMVVWPLITFVELTSAGPAVAPSSSLGWSGAGPGPAPEAERLSRSAPETAPVAGRALQGLPSFSLPERARSYLVLAWCAGALLFLLRLAGGWGLAAYLVRSEARAAPPEWQQRLDGLLRRVGLDRPVGLRLSSQAGGPYVFGWLRPVIVFPASVIVALPPWQVEAILAHELAHIKRYDFLVSALQSVAEALLFYHPAAWWASGQVRAEREHCCDDLAAAASSGPLPYARALTELEGLLRELEGLRAGPARLVPGASGGDLMGRVHRLLGLSRRRPPASEVCGLAGAAFLLLCMSVLVVACSDLAPTEPSERGRVAVEATELPAELHRMLERGDGAALIEALHARREAGAERALPVVLAAYRGAASAELRSSIAHALSHFFTPAADEALGRIAREDPSAEVRYSAVWAFQFRLSGLGLQDPGELTPEELREAEEAQRRRALHNGPMYPLLREIATDEGEEAAVRGAALRVLRVSGYEEGSFYEGVYRRSRQPRVRSAALWELGSLGEEAFPVLAEALEAEADPEVRRGAVRALRLTGHPPAVPILAGVARGAAGEEAGWDQEAGWAATGALLSLAHDGVAGAEEVLEELRREGIRIEVW